MPIFAKMNIRVVNARNVWDDRRRTSCVNQFVICISGHVAGFEILDFNRFRYRINRQNVMLHLHVSTQRSQCFRTGIKHFFGVTDMITNPQSDAT